MVAVCRPLHCHATRLVLLLMLMVAPHAMFAYERKFTELKPGLFGFFFDFEFLLLRTI